MATLTQTAYIARKVIKFGIIGLIAFIVLRASYITFKKWYANRFPTPPTPPNTAFGKLKSPKFPIKENLPAFSYKLETISGSLSTMPNQGQVFFMPQPSVNLFALENTINWAKLMGFYQEPQISDYNLRFTNGPDNSVLIVNYLKKNFIYTSDWKNNPDITTPKNPPDQQTLVAIAKAYLKKKMVLSSDLENGTGEVIYLKYEDGNLIETNRFEANLAKINLFREDLNVQKEASAQPQTEKIKVLPDNPKQANVWLLISPNISSNDGVLETHYQDFPISQQKFASYPFRDINQAWTQLLAGKGYIANLGDNQNGNISIRRVYLAYFDSEQSQDYLQPVFVFEGDRGFFAYVPAISEEWLAE